MTIIAVVDTETDRLLDEEGDASVIELATVLYRVGFGAGEPRSWLFAPGEGGVTARASAVHHLTGKNLKCCPPFNLLAWRLALDGAEYVAAHNAAFDRAQIERAIDDEHTAVPSPHWLCTLKLSRIAFPDAISYSNQALRYWLDLDGLIPPGLYPHRAAYDVIVTSWLLGRLLEYFEGDLERMVKISTEPSLLPRINFGKHRGMTWQEAPKDYLRWVLGQTFDEDTLHTARYWSNR